MDTTGHSLRAASMRWNTMKNFAEKPCMILMAMKRLDAGKRPIQRFTSKGPGEHCYTAARIFTGDDERSVGGASVQR
jgi:hypothetical protein